MAVREIPLAKDGLYTVDDIWALECNPATEHLRMSVIDGELYEDSLVTIDRSFLIGEIGYCLWAFVREMGVGKVMIGVHHYTPRARDTALRCDVGYSSHKRLATSPPNEYVRAMPDIAVEAKARDIGAAQLRRKAEAYLLHGSTLVWLVLPDRQGVEVWQLGEDGVMQSHFIDRNSTLRGEPALPGFTLELSKLFPPEND